MAIRKPSPQGRIPSVESDQGRAHERRIEEEGHRVRDEIEEKQHHVREDGQAAAVVGNADATKRVERHEEADRDQHKRDERNERKDQQLLVGAQNAKARLCQVDASTKSCEHSALP